MQLWSERAKQQKVPKIIFSTLNKISCASLKMELSLRKHLSNGSHVWRSRVPIAPMLDKGVGIKYLPNYLTLRFIQPNTAKSLRLKLLRWA